MLVGVWVTLMLLACPYTKCSSSLGPNLSSEPSIYRHLREDGIHRWRQTGSHVLVRCLSLWAEWIFTIILVLLFY
jgi:hypothetical protein